jgi:predicted acyl esterase
VEYRFRSPTRRPEDNGAPPPRHRRDTADGVIIERDAAVGVRGGVTVYADVLRPADERPAPGERPGGSA